MNKILRGFLGAVCFAVMLFMTIISASAFSGLGDGSSGDPFQITNCTQLQEMNDNVTANYVLTNDVDCSDTVNWARIDGTGFEPIGTSPYASFSGVLDGRGYSIINFYTNTTSITYESALINHIENAVIRNLSVVNATALGTYGAILVSYSNGGSNLIDNVFVSGIVNISGNYAGGLISDLNGNDVINNTGAYVDVYGGGSYVGGLVASINVDSTIQNSYVVGSVMGSDVSGSSVGGVVGYVWQGKILNSSFNGSLNSVSQYSGGLAGQTVDAVIDNSYAVGTLNGVRLTGGLVGEINNPGVSINNSYFNGVMNIASGDSCGGLIGSADGYARIENSYSKGILNATGIDYVGGLTSYSASGIDIINSYSDMEVYGDDYVAGFIGYADAGFDVNIYDSYSSSLVSGTTNLGGLIGFNASGVNVTSSYYDANVSGQSDDDGRGVPKSTADMQLQATFTGWDFTSTWEMIDYPHLQWEGLALTSCDPLTNLTCGLVEYWSMDENASTLLGREGKYNLTQYGTPIFLNDTNCMGNGCWRLEGSGGAADPVGSFSTYDRSNPSNMALYDNESVCLVYWANITNEISGYWLWQFSDAGGWYGLSAELGDGASGGIRYHAIGGQFGSGGYAYTNLHGGSSFGGLHHYAICHDPVQGLYSSYVDGILEFNGTITAYPDDSALSFSLLGNHPRNAGEFNFGVPEPMVFDEIGIYNRMLTESQISYLASGYNPYGENLTQNIPPPVPLVVVQEQPLNDAGYGAIGRPDGYAEDAFLHFLANSTYNLSVVSLLMADNGATGVCSPNLEVQGYDSSVVPFSKPSPNGTVYGNSSATALTDVYGAPGNVWVNFTFSTPVEILQGQDYTIVLNGEDCLAVSDFSNFYVLNIGTVSGGMIGGRGSSSFPDWYVNPIPTNLEWTYQFLAESASYLAPPSNFTLDWNFDDNTTADTTSIYNFSNTGADFVTGLNGSGIFMNKSDNDVFEIATDFGNNGIGVGACFWYKPNDFSTQSGIFNFYEANTDTVLTIDHNPPTDNLRFYRTTAGVTSDVFATTLVLPSNIYSALCIGYDGAYVHGYVDGVEVGNLSSAGIGVAGVSPGLMFGYPSPTYIGDGTFDSLRFFNYSITQSDVNTWYSETWVDQSVSEVVSGYTVSTTSLMPVANGDAVLTLNLTLNAPANITVDVFGANYSTQVTCSGVSEAICSVNVPYYAPEGEYYVNLSDGALNQSLGNVFNYSGLLIETKSADVMSFSGDTFGLTDVQVDAPIIIYNSGNKLITNLTVTGYDLVGQSAPSIVLNVSSFRAGTTLNNSVVLENGVPVSVPFTIVPGNNSYAEFYLWVSIPTTQYPQRYISTTSWGLSIS